MAREPGYLRHGFFASNGKVTMVPPRSSYLSIIGSRSSNNSRVIDTKAVIF